MLQRINTFKRGFLFLPIQSKNNAIFLKWENKILPSTSKIFPYYTGKKVILFDPPINTIEDQAQIHLCIRLRKHIQHSYPAFLRSAAFRIILHIETWVLLKHPTGALLRKSAKHHAPLLKMASGIITLLPINGIWSLKAVRFI